MAVTGKCYGLFFQSLANKEVDWNTDTIKCMLTTVTYVPDQDTHQYKSSVTNEVVGTGYTAGGVALATPTITYTAATNKLMLDAGDASWAASTITARIAVVYDDTPATDATKPLAVYQDFGADVSTTNGTFTVQWSASGIVEITVA